ncbi:MAG: hypothetical protein M1834_005524 [Cirrosporium novae-zelandiae]|nr:MAG: hypothetical protein M1834_005524 [Cirrosporium novae-zelandiae]
MATSKQETDHSILEVDHRQDYIILERSFSKHYSNLEINRDPADVPFGGNEGIIPVKSEWEPVDPETSLVEPAKPVKKVLGIRRKTFWILTGIVGVIIIGVVLGGALGGTLSRSQKSATATETAQLSATTGNLSVFVSATSTTGIRKDSSLAAVVWNSSLIEFRYRVYYQDENDHIKEIAWDTASNSWTSPKSIGTAKAGSPLAAAVKGPLNNYQRLDVYYFDDNNIIQGLLYNASSATWQTSSIGKENYKADPSSKISSAWEACELCSNSSHVVYQDRNHEI